MTRRIEHKAETTEFADELSEEALDEIDRETRVPACCAFCGGGGSGWVRPSPLLEKP